MPNVNLVKASNKLDMLKKEVTGRTERSRDENGNLSSESFRVMNPDIAKSMGEYLQERTVEAEALKGEIADYMKAETAMGSFDALFSTDGQKSTWTPQPSDLAINLSDQILKSESYDDLAAKRVKSYSGDHDIHLKQLFGQKALFETTSAMAADNVSVESIRTGEYIMAPRTRVSILDIIPQLTTAFPVVKYDEETKNLSGAGSIAQGGTYQQSEFTIEEKSVNVDKSGTFIQVSEELLQDRPEMRRRMDGSLMSQLMRRIQGDIVGGTTLANATEYIAGAAANANIAGFLDIPDANTNVLNTQTGLMSGEKKNEIESIEEGAELVYRNGIAESSAMLMNSQDWTKVKTLQSTTGSFVLRGANAPLWMPVERMIDDWPVVLCNALPVGTVIIGDFVNYCAIRDRQSVQVRIQEAQSIAVPAATALTNSVTVQTAPSGLFNIFADVRYAFYVTRPLAFTRITNFGIVTP